MADDEDVARRVSASSWLDEDGMTEAAMFGRLAFMLPARPLPSTG
jgi:hypothetical protein